MFDVGNDRRMQATIGPNMDLKPQGQSFARIAKWEVPPHPPPFPSLASLPPPMSYHSSLYSGVCSHSSLDTSARRCCCCTKLC